MLSRDALRRLAGATWSERGERYAADSAVSALVEDGGVMVARVQGTSAYRLESGAHHLQIALGGRPLRRP